MSQMNKESFMEWNEAMSIKHNPDYHHNHPNPIMRFLERRRTDSILRYLNPKVSEYLLDVGCGAGNMLGQVREGSLFGVDISDFVLGLARKRLGEKAVLYRGDAEHLPFKKNSLDKVFCSEVIEHTLHPEKVIQEISRVLKPNGTCVFSIPNEKFTVRLKSLLRLSGISRLILPANQGDESKLYDIHEWHLHCFSLALLKKITQGKFEITAKKGIPFGIMPVKYVVRLRRITG